MTQLESLYEHMVHNGSVTGMECIVDLGIMNYKGRIADLRALGFVIDTVMETTVNSKGQKKTYARYILKGYDHTKNRKANRIPAVVAAAAKEVRHAALR